MRSLNFVVQVEMTATVSRW